VPAALMISTASLAVLAVPPTRVVPLSFRRRRWPGNRRS
jgi:hypothetical protein